MTNTPTNFDGLDELGARAGWGSEDPEQLLLASLRRDALHAAFSRLSDADREILVLRDLEDLTGETVANILDLDIAGRLRARLRTEIVE